MVYLTQSDIDVRLQAAYCCAGSLAFKTSKEFRYGMKCAKSNLEKLFLLNVLIEILECYIPASIPDGEDEYEENTGNCITEEKAQLLFEKISKDCKTCFETINKTY
jgi:hypothetical protein